MQISNQIPSSYCSTDVHCYNSLTFLNTLTTSWLKKCFCHYMFYCFWGFFLFGFFFCIYLNTCTCKRLYNVCTLVLEENTNTSIYSQCWPTHPYFTNQSFYRISTVLDNCRYCPEKIILKFDLISVFEFLTWMNEFFFTTKC